MVDLLLLGLTASVLTAMLSSALRPGGYLTVPFTLGGVLLGWVVPQLWALRSDASMPPDGFKGLILMALLCFLAAIVGWFHGLRRQSGLRRARVPLLRVERMVVPVSLLTAFAFAMHLGMEMQPEESRSATQWSGPITIFAFFAQLRIVALILSLLMVLTCRTMATVALASANLALTVPVAFVALRREEMVDVGLAIAGALWFGRRISLPLPLVVAVGVALAVVVFSIGELRSASAQVYRSTGERPSLMSSEVFQAVDISRVAEKHLALAPDLRNASYLIEFTDLRRGYALGANTWNDLVHQWVPGQIVGRDLKSKLMVGGGWRGEAYSQMENQLGFRYLNGTTATGFGSAYQDFGYIGAIYFFAIGAILGRLFERARSGDPWFQTLFLACTTLGMTSITHQHTKLFVTAPLLVGSIFCVRWLTRRAGGRERFLRFRSGRTAERNPSHVPPALGSGETM